MCIYSNENNKRIEKLEKQSDIHKESSLISLQLLLRYTISSLSNQE